MSRKEIDEQELREFMKGVGPDTKIYFGCDSERVQVKGQWFADYITVIVVHINGRHGCKIFGQSSRERDYDSDASKPFQRMFTEARLVSELYNKFKDLFEDYECAIHIDISTKKTAGSNIALPAATGYIQSMTQVTPIPKPLAWCASYAADRAKELGVCA